MKNRKVFTLLLTGMLALSMGNPVYASGTDAAIAEAQAEKQAAEEGLAQAHWRARSRSWRAIWLI